MAITRATNLAGLGTVFDALTDGGGLSISGISTFTDLNITRANVTGVSTFATLNITNSNPTQLNVTGLGTFSNGPVLIGSASSTGTASQRLQVTGGAYVSGNIGIGITNPSQKLEVVGGEIKAGRVDSNEEGGQVSFGRATDNATGWYLDVYGSTSTPNFRVVDVSNSAVRATFDNSGNLSIANGNLVIGTSGKGIDFSANSNAAGMSSELLDDYEEGSFTPTITGSISNPSPTYITAFTWGYYTKVGDKVFISIEIRTSTTTGGSGELRISGLPFNATSRNSAVLCFELPIQVYNINFDSTYIWNAEIAGGTGFAVIRGGSSGGVGANLLTGAWTASNPTLIRITGCYHVD